MDAFKSSDNPEDIIAKNAFDPFDEAIGDDDEEIQYLKRCIQKCNSKKLTHTDGRRGNSLGDLRNVIINISGAEFRTKWKNLKKYHKSRLGKISLARSLEECSELCDGFIPGNPPVIFFHRNSQNFCSISDFYRDSGLHVCEQTCAIVAQNEFRFWGFDEFSLQPCCMLKYFPTTVSAKNELEEEKIENQLAEERVRDENFGSDRVGKLRSFLWDLLEYPETSKAAQGVAFASIFFVILSTVTFMIESSFEEDMENILDEDSSLEISTI